MSSFRQRSKLAHRVPNALSPSVTGTPPQAASNRWPEARSTPPPVQPQFFNPSTLGVSPVPSPGPPQQQQQTWQQQQPQQYSPQQQQQQWYNQPTSKVAATPPPPVSNNNNNISGYNADPWSWGPQGGQWETSSPNQQPAQITPQHQVAHQQVPSQQQSYQQNSVMQQQPQQGYQQQPQQKDAWDWGWNQGNQDAVWNWGSEDSTPSTDTSSNGPQHVPTSMNQYQQNYQQFGYNNIQQQQQYPDVSNTAQQHYSSSNVTPQQQYPEVNNTTQSQYPHVQQQFKDARQQQYSPEVVQQTQQQRPPEIHHEQQQLINSSQQQYLPEVVPQSQQQYHSETLQQYHSETLQQYPETLQQYPETPQQLHIDTITQQLTDTSIAGNGSQLDLNYSAYSEQNNSYLEQDLLMHSEQQDRKFVENGRESNLEIDYSHRESMSYSEQGRESLVYSEQSKGSLSYLEHGRESSFSERNDSSRQSAFDSNVVQEPSAYSEQGRESAYSERHQRESSAYSEQDRESTYSERHQRESIAYSEQDRESAYSEREDSRRDSRSMSRQEEVRPDLIDTESSSNSFQLIVEENAQQPPDLVTDFENREVVPPDFSQPLYPQQKQQTLVPTSSTLVAAAIGANLETLPDNIERPEDTMPLQPLTPPPPSLPTNQGRLGVGQDDPSPWPNTIPPPENQEIATNLPPPPSVHPQRHHATPPLPPPPSVDPVSASDRNQFLETGQLSADIPMYSRRQTIPGESRQSPEPGLRVVPGTTEPDEPLPGSRRSETIGSDFDEVRPSIVGTNMLLGNTRTNGEGIHNEPMRILSISDMTEQRPSVEGNQSRPQIITTTVRPPQEAVRTFAVGNDTQELRPNVEGNQSRPLISTSSVRPTPEPIRTVTVGNDSPEQRPNTEGNQTRPPIGNTSFRSNEPRLVSVRNQPPRSVLGGTEVPRTVAEGTNDDLRRLRSTTQSLVTPPPRIGSQERLSAFTEVRNVPPVQNRPPPETQRSSGEGDNPSGSDLEDGEISDLDNVSSGELEKEDGELDATVEERNKEEPRKKSPPARDIEDHRPPPSDTIGTRRTDKQRRSGERAGSGERDRRSAERDRRGKPPRPQDDKRRDRETPPPRSSRHRRRYQEEDSDSYHSERGERDDRMRKYREDPKRRSPDRRHRSSRHGRHDYYAEDYRYHGDYRRDYDDRYHHRGSRPSSRAGSEARRGGPDYESDHQSQKSHREERDRERVGHNRSGKPPPSGPYYDKYGRYVRPDPRDSYYRDPYNYYAHYNYAPQPVIQPAAQPMQHPEYNQYSFAYFEELRRNNPVAYAEWYRKYITSQPGPGSSVNLEGYAEEDRNSRGSVHSGQSSINEEIRYQARLQHGRSPAHSLRDYSCSPYHPHSGLPPQTTHTPASLPPTYPQQYPYQAIGSRSGSAANRTTSPAASAPRLTPVKFSCAHAAGRLCTQGRLVHVLPHLPRDGQTATVLIHDLGTLLDSDYITDELRAFPGPLVKGITHKNSVIHFCTLKIKAAQTDPLIHDRDSYILIWKLLILLLRQNGTVVGTDIAELLLEDARQDDYSRSRSPSPSREDSGPSSFRGGSHSELTHRFRQFLLYGNTKEALDWAMKNGLWGHALFLASKMDARTYANVMTRFANGLPLNDPLQTLYQLMSGRQPAAVTSCADEKWGDWKPHLAMILSNPSQRPELDHRAITTLGDTLGSRGCLHASHFCYLLAQLDFGTHCQQPPAKLVLLGASHTTMPLELFASCEAIQCTEVYEYACRLANPNFYLPHFQVYKFMYACRLVEHGFPAEGLQYCEEIAGALLSQNAAGSVLAQQLVNLADALKFSDPTVEPQHGGEGGDSFYASDPAWLQQLRQFADQTASLSEGVADLSLNYMNYSQQSQQLEQESQQQQQQQPQDSLTLDEQWQEYYRQQQQWGQQQQQQQQQQQAEQQQTSEPPQIAANDALEIQHPEQQSSSATQQLQYWQPSQQPWTPSTPDAAAPTLSVDDSTKETSQSQAPLDYWSMNNSHNYSADQSESNGPTPCPDSVSKLKALVPMRYSQHSHFNISPQHMPFQIRPRRDPLEPFLARLLPIPSKRTIYLGDKPLVFGGTYPIDKPIASRFLPVKTFNIDQPADFAKVIQRSRSYQTTEALLLALLQPEPTPTITMAGQRRKTLSESSTDSHKTPKRPVNTPQQQPLSPVQQQNSGWFGGFWNKLSLKPKNQMKLPDDKNPKIIWDSERKRWVNTEEDADEAVSELKPPPRAMAMNSSQQSQSPAVPTPSSNPIMNSQLQSNSATSSSAPPPLAGSGYKLGKSMRKNYVNVLQQNGTATQPSRKPAPSEIFPNVSQPSAPVNFFIPSPVATNSDIDSATQFTTSESSAPETPQNSDQDHAQPQIPTMYNPTQFTGVQNDFSYQR